MGEKVKGLRSTNSYLQNSHEDVKYNIGNKVATEFMHKAHKHEQKCGGLLEGVGKLEGGGQCREDWDTYNGIINKI